MSETRELVGGRCLPANDQAPFKALVRALAALAHDDGPKILVPGQDGGATAVNVRIGFNCMKGCWHSWLWIAQTRKGEDGRVVVVPMVMEEETVQPEVEGEENEDDDEPDGPLAPL